MREGVAVAYRLTGKVEGEGGALFAEGDVLDDDMFGRMDVKQVGLPDVFAAAVGDDLHVGKIFVKAQGSRKVVERKISAKSKSVDRDGQQFGVVGVGADPCNVLAGKSSKVNIMPAVVGKAVGQNGVARNRKRSSS